MVCLWVFCAAFKLMLLPQQWREECKVGAWEFLIHNQSVSTTVEKATVILSKNPFHLKLW